MQTSNRRIWLGVVLIILGSLFFLDNLRSIVRFGEQLVIIYYFLLLIGDSFLFNFYFYKLYLLLIFI